MDDCERAIGEDRGGLSEVQRGGPRNVKGAPRRTYHASEVESLQALFVTWDEVHLPQETVGHCKERDLCVCVCVCDDILNDIINGII